MAVNIEDIDSPEKLEEYLRIFPASLKQVIAFRCAMRSILAASNDDTNVSEMIFKIFRANLISGMNSKYLSQNFTGQALRAAEYANKSFHLSQSISIAKIIDAAHLSAFTVKEFRDQYTFVKSVPSIVLAAAAAFGDNAKFIWSEMQSDFSICDGQDESSSLRDLLNAPLLSLDAPFEIQKNWNSLKDNLLAQNPNWQVWIDWYEHVLHGAKSPKRGIAALSDEKLIELVQKPKEFWEREPEDVNAEIAGWVEEAEKLEDWKNEEGNIDEPVFAYPDEKEFDFFISYSTKDEAMAREVASVIEDAGYTVFAQYKNFEAGTNIVRMMQRGLDKSMRVIALYTPDYEQSDHCQAEWAAAYNSDPSGEKRVLLPFMVEPTALNALARQIVYHSLVGKSDAERKAIILTEISSVPPLKLKNEIRDSLSNMASPDVRIVGDTILDAIPNEKYDQQYVGDDLYDLPEIQRTVIEAIVNALGDNAPKSIKSSLEQYEKHLAKRGAKPITNLLDILNSAVEAEFNKADLNDWGSGLSSLFNSYFEQHSLLMAHFPLRQDREELFSKIEIDEDSATGPDLRDPIIDVTDKIEDLSEAGKTTDNLDIVSAAIKQQAIDLSYIGSMNPDDKVGNVASPKKRFILSNIGYFERMIAVIGSVVTILQIPQVQALLISLKSAVEALMMFVL